MLEAAATRISRSNRSAPSVKASSRVQHLERDRAVVPDVPRQDRRRHAAAAELALERVAAGERLLDLRAELGLHGVPATSRWKRGFARSGSKVGSIRSQAGER